MNEKEREVIKCPECGKEDFYSYLGYDDECRCLKCGAVFAGSGYWKGDVGKKQKEAKQ